MSQSNNWNHNNPLPPSVTGKFVDAPEVSTNPGHPGTRRGNPLPDSTWKLPSQVELDKQLAKAFPKKK